VFQRRAAVLLPRSKNQLPRPTRIPFISLAGSTVRLVAAGNACETTGAVCCENGVGLFGSCSGWGERGSRAEGYSTVHPDSHQAHLTIWNTVILVRRKVGRVQDLDRHARQ